MDEQQGSLCEGQSSLNLDISIVNRSREGMCRWLSVVAWAVAALRRSSGSKTKMFVSSMDESLSVGRG